MSKKVKFILQAIILFVVYLSTAKFGLSLYAVSGFATLIWLPTGISLAALLLFGFRLWPGIFLGAFLANFSNNAPILVALGIGVGNTLEAILGAYFLKRFGFHNTIGRLSDVMLLVLVAVFSSLISASIGVASLFLGRIATTPTTWLAWWVGDMISVLIVTSFILILSGRHQFNLSLKRGIEVLIFLIVLVLVVLGVIQVIPAFFVGYLIFPMLIWASVRFKQKGAVLANLSLAVAIILRNILSPPEKFPEQLLQGQIFIATTSMVTLFLAVIASEREKLEARKDEFISVASHELKTPITTIKGYNQILTSLLSKSKNRELLSYVSKMDEQLNRLTKLVNDLLDVSKIQSGKLVLEKEKFDLNELTQDVVADLQLSTTHQLIFQPEAKQLAILADKHLLSAVLINLISNAIKYSPRGKKVIIKTSNGGMDAAVSVQDFGIGIARKDQKKIFERFYQADIRIRQSFQGLGLGLYISQQIVKQHGGEIKVDSVKGKGTTFSFKLPKSLSHV